MEFSYITPTKSRPSAWNGGFDDPDFLEFAVRAYYSANVLETEPSLAGKWKKLRSGVFQVIGNHVFGCLAGYCVR